ncbi:MAG: alpha/beta fold hydrolase [Granulosicoccaceae bacterium]
MTFSIHTHRWRPGDAPRQSRGVYILHGAGEHGMRYDRFAKYLTGLGYVVGAHDHPGHGKSDGKRGIIVPEQSLVEHAAEKLKEFTQETGAAPILFGHSLGGVVAATVAFETKVPLAGLILSAPAFELSISPLNRFKLNAFNAIAPYHAQDLPYDPTRLTQDKIEQQIAIDDPLMHGFKSASYVVWLIKAGEAVFELAASLNVNTLLLIPEDDPVVSPDRAKEFAVNAPAAKIFVNCYPGYKHEVLNEMPERRNKVMSDIGEWLRNASLLA